MATTQHLAKSDKDSVGARLCRARESLGLSIREVAKSLNLMVSHVRGIETDRFAELTNHKQFLRHVYDYAMLVKLDADEVVEQYRTQSAAVVAAIQPHQGEQENRYDGKWYAVAALAIACAGLGIWAVKQTMLEPSSNREAARQEPPGEAVPSTDERVEIAAAEQAAKTETSKPDIAEKAPVIVSAVRREEETKPRNVAMAPPVSEPATIARSEQAALEATPPQPAKDADDTNTRPAKGKNPLLTIGAKPLRKTLVELKTAKQS